MKVVSFGDSNFKGGSGGSPGGAGEGGGLLGLVLVAALVLWLSGSAARNTGSTLPPSDAPTSKTTSAVTTGSTHGAGDGPRPTGR